jgi:PKD repeat protein
MSKMKFIFIFFLICLLIGFADAIDLNEGITSSLHTEVNLTDGDVTFASTNDGLSVAASTVIDDTKFIPSQTKKDGENLIWTTGEKDWFIYDNPNVSISYDYNGTFLKETIILKEDKELKFPLKIANGSKIIDYNGGFRIIPDIPLSTSKDGGYPSGIVISQPFGTDAAGRYVPMNYVYDGETLSLEYNRTLQVYNETLTKEINQTATKSFVESLLVPQYDYVPISYPLTIDPTYYLDGYHSYLKLLMHMNGTNDGTVFTDETGKTITRYGNTVTKTAIKQLGNASGYFDGAGDYIYLSSSTDFTFTNPSTISFWYYPLDTSVVNLFGQYASEQSNTYFTPQNGQLYLVGGTVLRVEATTANTYVANTWNHICIVINGSKSKIYVNGIDKTTSVPKTGNYPSVSSPFYLGQNGNGNTFVNGYIDEFAIWNGISVPISELYPQTTEIETAIAPIATFTTNVTSGIAPIVVQFNETSVSTGTSWQWNATNVTGNDVPFTFSTIQNATYTFNQGNYTIQLTSTNSGGSNVSTQLTWINVSSGEGKLITDFTANPVIGYQYSMPVAFTDISMGSTTWNWTFGDGYTSTLQNPSHTYMVAGKYDIGLNVTNSSGYYNSTTKTSYITLLSDSDSYLRSWNDFNSTISNDHQGVAWTSFGTPSISTTTKKFGAGSLYIPDYIYSPSSSIWDRSNTAGELEFWINITTLGDAGKPILKRSTGAGTSDGWGLLNINGTHNGYAFWYGNSATNYTKPFTLTSNVWHHVTLTRNTSAYWNVYVDGNLWSATYLNSLQVDTANQFQIGATGPGNEFIFYLDEFRYSQGVDRVDASFSVPNTAYVGTLQASIDTSPNSTLRYKTNPDMPAYIYNQTNGGTRNRTLQIQNISEATYITGALSFDPTTERVKNFFVNSTDYSDIILVSSGVNYVNGEVTFNVSRGGTLKFTAPLDTRVNLLDVQFLYYNYTTQQTGTQFFDYGYLINGTSSYPIHNFIPTNVTYGDWVIMSGFSANRTTVNAGNPIQFSDLSTGEPVGYTSWLWNFGDGSTSTQQNPIYSYAANGLYTVSLKSSLVANASVTNTTTKTGYINVTSAILSVPVVDFSASPTIAAVGSTVTFVDASTNSPASWLWNFGDGSESSIQNPSHIYSSVGNYTVTLNATNTYGTGTLSKTNYIQIKSSVEGFNRQDLVLGNLYTLTITVTDSATSAVLSGVSISDDTTGTSAVTDSNGIAVLTDQPYGVITGSLTKDGYSSKTFSVVMVNDTSLSLTLTTASTTSTNVWYSPKQIGVSVVRYNPAGQKVKNATVSLAAIASTLQDNSQLQTLYGIDSDVANQMMNGTLLMTGITGGDGATAFTVLSSIQYRATVTDPIDSKVYTTTINPAQDPYTIWIGTSPLVVQNTSYSTTNNTALYVTQPNSSYVTLNLRYQDTSNSTSNVMFYVVAANNMTTIYSVNLGNPGTQIVYANHTHKNTRGNGYFYYYNATRSA